MWVPDRPDHPFYDDMVTMKETVPDGVWQPVWAAYALKDLWFLVRYVLSTELIPQVKDNNQFVFDRCRDVQADPNGYLDIWAREHFKSTIITFAKTIQDLAEDSERTFGIFSHTRPIAKGFLRVIKQELEENTLLKSLYPDSFYWNPKRDSPKWNEDDGIVVKRKGNPKESSVEAHGLVDGQPTSKHYWCLLFDDTVTDKSVTTPEMIKKTTDAWELAGNLGQDGGVKRHIGTRYHLFDTYSVMIERGVVKLRIFPCVDDPDQFPNGDWKPVCFSRQYIEEKRRSQGEFTFSAQNLCDPLSEEQMGFDVAWLNYFKEDAYKEAAGKNIYILVDPASRRKPASEATNDYTAMWVVGCGADKMFYVLDLIRDRLNLTERAQTLMDLHRTWEPNDVAYEEYGMQSDIEYIEEVQARQGYRFAITKVAGSHSSKAQRIQRLVPKMEEGRFYFPEFGIWRRLKDGRRVDLVQEFINDELKAYPLCKHEDCLDSLSRLFCDDFNYTFPKGRPRRRKHDAYDHEPEEYAHGATWMSA
jgi:predicted phage terminase large subunit-like protein